MVSYMMIAVNEQHQEFAVLRSIGAKPRFVMWVLALQSAVLLLSSFGIGISLGTIITMLILMPQPIVTAFTILEIAGFPIRRLSRNPAFEPLPSVQGGKSFNSKDYDLVC